MSSHRRSSPSIAPSPSAIAMAIHPLQAPRRCNLQCLLHFIVGLRTLPAVLVVAVECRGLFSGPYRAVDHCAKSFANCSLRYPVNPPIVFGQILTLSSASDSYCYYSGLQCLGRVPRLIYTSCRVLIAYSPTYRVAGANTNRISRMAKLHRVV